jgi:23S rRNA (cytosine1962-C5)-methyltransferase
MSNEYELLDVGDGRKWERFGAATVVRPAPGVSDPPRLDAARWSECDAEFVGRASEGRWRLTRPFPQPWTARWHDRRYVLDATATGQVGWFPEQEPLRDRVAALLEASSAGDGATPHVLDLFGYTGGSTIAALRAGASVTWVDASKSAAARSRRNADANDVGGGPVRWIVEDVPRFVDREARRGVSYQGILLDPPSFGRGPKGEVWKIDKDLKGLLTACARLLADDALFLLVSAHTESWTMQDLAARGRAVTRVRSGREHAIELELASSHGARLSSGNALLWDFT